MQFCQLLLIQVGLFVNPGLVSKLWPRVYEGRDTETWNQEPGQEARLLFEPEGSSQGQGGISPGALAGEADECGAALEYGHCNP